MHGFKSDEPFGRLSCGSSDGGKNPAVFGKQSDNDIRIAHGNASDKERIGAEVFLGNRIADALQI
jgi:hypothetical protein